MARRIIIRFLNNPRTWVFMIIGGIIGWLLIHTFVGIAVGVILGGYLSYNT